jgi:hypothetical protein
MPTGSQFDKENNNRKYKHSFTEENKEKKEDGSFATCHISAQCIIFTFLTPHPGLSLFHSILLSLYTFFLVNHIISVLM